METTLAKPEPQNTALAVGQNELDIMFGNDRAQVPVDAALPQVKILRESPNFELPDGSIVKEIFGHILYYSNANKYYSTPFGDDSGSVIPDCFSVDGINPSGGTDQQARSCHDCEYNKYESAADGKGKACSNTIRMYLLLDGDILPVLLVASPASLSKKESLMRWLTNAANVANKAGCGTAYQVIKAKFSLHKKDFTSGFSASVLDVSTISVLDPKNKDNMKQIQQLAAMTKMLKESYLGKEAERMAVEVQDGDITESNDDTKAGDDVPI